MLTEFFTNLIYATAKLNKLINNIIKKNKKGLFTLSPNGLQKIKQCIVYIRINYLLEIIIIHNLINKEKLLTTTPN